MTGLKLDNFGERLFYWIQRRGFSVTEVARLAGMAQSTLSELGANQRISPRATHLLALCDVLKLQPLYLLYGTGPAEELDFQRLSGDEAQLVMHYRLLAPNKQSEIQQLTAKAGQEQLTQFARPLTNVATRPGRKMGSKLKRVLEE